MVPTPVGVSGVSFDADRIYVFPGRTAVFPLTPPEEARSAGLNWRPNHLPKVVLEGGREVIPRVYRLTGSPEGSGPDRPSAKNDSWLGPRVIWTVELFNPASPPPPVAAGTVIGPVWLAAMDMPTDIDPRELPRFVRIDGSAAPVTWMARPPSAIDTAMLPEFDKTPGMGPGPGAIAALGEIIRPLASDPTERWRARMLTERFGARPLWGDATPPDLAGALPEPLEQSATQLETCIRVALDNLRRIDRPLAAQVQNRLLHIVRAPTGVLLPAWPPTDADLTELMTRLLDPRPLRAERVDAAHAWLAKLPTIQAWVIDDLGAPSSPAGSEPTIGVADLSGNGGGVSLYTDVGNPIPLLSLTPGGSTAARVSVPLTGPGRTLHAQCMPSPTIDLHLFGGLLPAKPPGAELGPLVQAWNHQTWSKRLAQAAPTRRSARVLIQKAAGTGGGGGSAEGAWEALVECPLSESEPTDSAQDIVRLWFGPYGATRGVIELTLSGARLLDSPPGAAGTVASTGTTIPSHAAQVAGGWTGVVAIPDSLIINGASILVGIERITDGVHCTYPRPLLPGQTEPGRVGIDLTSWGGPPGP